MKVFLATLKSAALFSWGRWSWARTMTSMSFGLVGLLVSSVRVSLVVELASVEYWSGFAEGLDELLLPQTGKEKRANEVSKRMTGREEVQPLSKSLTPSVIRYYWAEKYGNINSVLTPLARQEKTVSFCFPAFSHLSITLTPFLPKSFHTRLYSKIFAILETDKIRCHQ